MVIVKEVLLKGLPKTWRENEENKGIYSCPAKVISNAILFVYSLRGILAKTSRVSLHEMAQFVLKIVRLTTFVF